MNQLIDTVNGWSSAWLDLMLAIVWQSTLLACVAALVAYALRRATPALNYWVWQVVGIKLLLMPFWTAWLPFPSMFTAAPVARDNESVAAKRVVAAGQLATPASQLLPADVAPAGGGALPALERAWIGRISLSAWLALVWLLVVLWQAARIVHQRIELGRLLTRAHPASDANLLRLLSDLAGQLGLARAPALVLTDRECSPFVFGLQRPILVLPGSLLPELNGVQLRQVLFHELAHIKRNDLLWGWPPVIARLVYWFHPVAHSVCYRIQLQRELACDQMAIALCGQGAAGYADTLVHVAGHRSARALFQAAAASAGFTGISHFSSVQKETCP